MLIFVFKALSVERGETIRRGQARAFGGGAVRKNRELVFEAVLRWPVKGLNDS